MVTTTRFTITGFGTDRRKAPKEQASDYRFAIGDAVQHVVSQAETHNYVGSSIRLILHDYDECWIREIELEPV